MNSWLQLFQYYQTPLGTIKMLTRTDSVKDRLASYFHWDDQQGLEQAINIYQEMPHKVNLKEIRKWSEKEGFLEKFENFFKLSGAI